MLKKFKDAIENFLIRDEIEMWKSLPLFCFLIYVIIKLLIYLIVPEGVTGGY